MRAGGVWNPVKPTRRLPGKAQWDTLMFIIPPKRLAPGKKVLGSAG